jgi:hypothetical protein
MLNATVSVYGKSRNDARQLRRFMTEVVCIARATTCSRECAVEGLNVRECLK